MANNIILYVRARVCVSVYARFFLNKIPDQNISYKKEIRDEI